MKPSLVLQETQAAEQTAGGAVGPFLKPESLDDTCWTHLS